MRRQPNEPGLTVLQNLMNLNGYRFGEDADGKIGGGLGDGFVCLVMVVASGERAAASVIAVGNRASRAALVGRLASMIRAGRTDCPVTAYIHRPTDLSLSGNERHDQKQ